MLLLFKDDVDRMLWVNIRWRTQRTRIKTRRKVAYFNIVFSDLVHNFLWRCGTELNWKTSAFCIRCAKRIIFNAEFLSPRVLIFNYLFPHWLTSVQRHHMHYIHTYIHTYTFWLGRSNWGNLKAGVDLPATQIKTIFTQKFKIYKKPQYK